jgi:hypothetical protein
MPRVTVVAEDRPDQILLDESVGVCHIDDQPYAVHFLERLAWAIHDGTEAESTRARKLVDRRRRIAGTPRPEPHRQRKQGALQAVMR